MNDRGNRENVRVSLELFRSEPQPCVYLPERQSMSEGLAVAGMTGRVYEHLMNLGFRRSGRYVYRPVCESCHECVPLRVPAASFRPSRSQRRVLKRNADINVTVDEPKCTDEKYRLFKAYLVHQHDGVMSSDRDDFEEFLYTEVTHTIEMTYRLGDRVVGIGLCDVCETCLSSVYFFFHPDEARRSLGTYSAMREIEECRRRGFDYWYAGYYIRDCARMNYKASFNPHELLDADGRWQSPH